MGRRLESDRGGYFRQAGPAWFRRGLTSLLRVFVSVCAWVRPALRSAGSARALPPQRWSNRRIFVPPGCRPRARRPLRRPPIAAFTAACRHGRQIFRHVCASSGDCSFCARGDRGPDRQPEPVQEYRADHGLGDRLGGAFLRIGVDRRRLDRAQSVGQCREVRCTAPSTRKSAAIEQRPAALHAMARCVARRGHLPALRVVRAHLGRQRRAKKPRAGPAWLFRSDLGRDASIRSTAMAATGRDFLSGVRAFQPLCTP
jgi:hypothetical protein